MRCEIETEYIKRPEHPCYDDQCDGYLIAPDPETHDNGHHYNCPECGKPFIIHLNRPGLKVRCIVR